MTRYDFESDDGPFAVDVIPAGDGFDVTVSGQNYRLTIRRGKAQNTFVAEFSEKPFVLTISEASSERVEMLMGGQRFLYWRTTAGLAPPSPGFSPASVQEDIVAAPMPGKVIGTLVKEGEKVRTGDPLVILESMKMEVAVRADRDAEVVEILVEEGAPVKRGQGLVRLR